MCCRKYSLKQELAPISFKQSTTELTLVEQIPQGVALLFPNGLRAHFGSVDRTANPPYHKKATHDELLNLLPHQWKL